MMKKYFLNSYLLIVFVLTAVGLGQAQNARQVQEMTRTYDKNKLGELEQTFQDKFLREQAEAFQLARQNGWPISFTDENGSYHKLRKVINGTPIYFQTENVNAAISTRADYLHNGGGLGLDLEGQGMTAHVWDGGVANVNHSEYDGPGGTDRFSIGDGSGEINFHAAHVTGTVIAYGASPAAKGMAPQANAVGYDWDFDLAEATAAASSGMLLSNHSYGIGYDGLADDNSWIIGAYIQESKDWDDLMYNAPYYLMVTSAGNDGNDDSTNSDPLGGNAAYDKLSLLSTAKNGLSVGSGSDAVINGDGSLGSTTRTSFSSEGPTDDFRIKPDIMGNGESLLSTNTGAIPAQQYQTLSGTSMSSPNVCGSLLLLQQHYNNINGSFMKAATLKGLALHTADDIEATGPDAHSGWGLLNTKAAAETITNNGLQSWVSEETLTNGGSFVMDVVSDGTSPLMASISWTDQGGTANNTGIFNDPTPVLVNDLDIRVTQLENTFMPWKLTAVDTNTQGDNLVDPYERVDILGASGTYRITVTHKKSLVGGSQNFSLVVTGITSDFTLNSQALEQVVCSDSDATYNFNYQQIGGGTTNFSTGGTPVGMTTSISPTSLSADGTFNVTFGNLINVPANTYTISVTGDNGDETETRSVNLRVLHSDFDPYPQNLSSPANGANEMLSSLSLEWSENLNAESYYVEVATNPSFSSVAYSGTVTDLKFDLYNLTETTVYYWRVRPDNKCNNGNFSDTFSFQTRNLTCASVSQVTPTTIEDLSVVTSTVDYLDSFAIGDVNVTVDYDHTWIGDVSLTLISPLGTRVTLIDVLTCTTETNFNFKFDDEASSDIDCTTGNGNYPTLNTYRPVSPLLDFNGEPSNGTWTLEISDEGPNDVGTVNSWTLELCDIVSANPPNFVSNPFSVPLNSTYVFDSVDFEATSDSETAAQQVYTLIEVPSLGALEKSSSALGVGDTFTQDDVNTGKMSFTNSETSAINDQFKVDITNAANGWLANQIITLSSTLGVNDFEFTDLKVWPNPTRGLVHIQFDNSRQSSNVDIELYDLQGRLIREVSYKASGGVFRNTLDLNNVASGNYLLKIAQDSRQVVRKVLISP
jgi:subtilisin-like proprotein convertase family protein